MRFTRTNGVWSATWLYGALPRFKDTEYTLALPAPKSGWSTFWQKMEKNSLLTLPDTSELPDDHIIMADGTSYVVEINQNNTYRTYYYNNPEDRERPEDRQMVKLIQIQDEEFRMKELRRKQYQALGKPPTPPKRATQHGSTGYTKR